MLFTRMQENTSIDKPLCKGKFPIPRGKSAVSGEIRGQVDVDEEASVSDDRIRGEFEFCLARFVYSPALDIVDSLLVKHRCCKPVG